MSAPAPRPRLSVLMPVRNGFPWLPQALASLLLQTHADFELIALEDGSTDDTPAFLRTVPDRRVRVIPTGGVGIACALNIGLEAACGEYIARHDADDESLPHRFARQLGFLDTHRDIDLVASVADYIDGHGQPIDNHWVRTIRRQQDTALTPEAIARVLPLTCCLTHGSVMARAAVLRQAGGYRAEFVPADDYDLWLRLLPSHRFAKLAEPLYRYRVHDSQLGAQTRSVQTTNAIAAKLLYLRRRYAHLGRPARLATVGSSRGDAYYRQAAPRAAFELVAPDQAWDVLAITDLGRVEEFGEQLGLDGSGGLECVGNFFVRVPVLVP